MVRPKLKCEWCTEVCYTVAMAWIEKGRGKSVYLQTIRNSARELRMGWAQMMQGFCECGVSASEPSFLEGP